MAEKQSASKRGKRVPTVAGRRLELLPCGGDFGSDPGDGAFARVTQAFVAKRDVAGTGAEAGAQSRA